MARMIDGQCGGRRIALTTDGNGLLPAITESTFPIQRGNPGRVFRRPTDCGSTKQPMSKVTKCTNTAGSAGSSVMVEVFCSACLHLSGPRW